MLAMAILGLALSAAPVTAVHRVDAPTQLTVTTCSAGEPYQFSTGVCTVELHNDSGKPLLVDGIRAILVGDRTEPESEILVPAKGVAYVKVFLDLVGKAGLVHHPFEITIDGVRKKFKSFYVTAFAQSVLDNPNPVLDFGTLRIGKDTFPVIRRVSLDSRDFPALKIEHIISTPEWLDVDIDDSRQAIKATLRDSVPWGLTQNGASYIKLALNTPEQDQVWVEVKAHIVGTVAPESNPFPLGMMRNVGKHEFLIRLSSPDGRAFRVGKMALSKLVGKARIVDCVPKVIGCKLIKLTVSNKQPLGKLVGVLNVELPDFQRILPINLYGVMLSPETKIQELDQLFLTQGNKSRVAEDGLDLKHALADAVKEPLPTLPGSGPLLRWSVSHQNRVYGYLLYRSESESGELNRVSKDVVVATKLSDDVSGDYQWRDSGAISGRTYWYQIRMLLKDGTKEDLGGRHKVVVK